MGREPLETELEQAFREDLIAACQIWGVDMSSSSSGTRLTELLAEKMRDKASRDAVFATLTQNEKDLLGMLTLNGGAMSYDRLKPYRKIYSYGQLNQTERDLRKKGLVIRRIMSRLTEYGREVAEFKIIDFFIPHLINYFSSKPVPDPERPKKAKTFVNERDSLLVDTLILLAHVTKNEVHMTSTWEFPRREIDRIKAVMSSPTDERFDIVQKMARKVGAYNIVENDRIVVVRPEVLFAGRQDAVARRFLLSVLGRTRAIWATPDQPTEYTLNLAICRLRESKEGEWVSVDELVDWIRSELFIENEPLKWIQVNAERVSIALETLILLGLVEAAYRGKTLLGVSLTPVGTSVIMGLSPPKYERMDTFIVQPNFEVNCYTTEMDYSKLYTLMLFTEPVKTDVVSIFRITDKSVFQAIETGMRESDILKFLETESSKPVPPNVSRSIRDWTSQMISATVDQVTLFETERAEELDNLLLVDTFNKYLVRRVGPTAAVINGDIAKMIEELRELRCNVKRRMPPLSTTDTGAGTHVAEQQVLIYGDPTLSDVPEACIACPAIQSCNRVIRRKARSTRGDTPGKSTSE